MLENPSSESEIFQGRPYFQVQTLERVDLAWIKAAKPWFHQY